MAQVDGSVGEVLAALGRTGLATNTLVFFTSDNGPEIVEIDPGAYARIQLFQHRSMASWRGVKRDIWEGGHRVPFLARWPGHIPPGSASGETICEVDLMATCAAVLGLDLPPDAAEDSWNILPALLAKQLDHPIREATVLHSANGHFALRQGDWVLIDAPTGDGGATEKKTDREPEWFKQELHYKAHSFPGELYNLRKDSTERENLYGQKPEVVERLKTLLEKYKADGRSAPMSASSSGKQVHPGLR